jgi:rubredoxin
MQDYICKTCGYVYNSADGDPHFDIAPGMPFEALSDDWHCPQCGSQKSEFELAENDPMPGMVIPVGE